MTRPELEESRESGEGAATAVVSRRAASRLERIIERVRATSVSRGCQGATLEDWLRAEREVDTEIESLDTTGRT